jgi:hypothetical protein
MKFVTVQGGSEDHSRLMASSEYLPFRSFQAGTQRFFTFKKQAADKHLSLQDKLVGLRLHELIYSAIPLFFSWLYFTAGDFTLIGAVTFFSVVLLHYCLITFFDYQDYTSGSDWRFYSSRTLFTCFRVSPKIFLQIAIGLGALSVLYGGYVVFGNIKTLWQPAVLTLAALTFFFINRDKVVTKEMIRAVIFGPLLFFAMSMYFKGEVDMWWIVAGFGWGLMVAFQGMCRNLTRLMELNRAGNTHLIGRFGGFDFARRNILAALILGSFLFGMMFQQQIPILVSYIVGCAGLAIIFKFYIQKVNSPLSSELMKLSERAYAVVFSVSLLWLVLFVVRS